MVEQKTSGSIEGLLIQNRFDRLFEAWNQKKGARDGLHASSVLADDERFCYREHVLGSFFVRETSVHSPRLLAIFLNGWFIHERYQQVFVEGLSEEERATLYTELSALLPQAGVSLPDVVKEKWQFLFDEIGGMADEVEQSHYAEEWGLSFTPDAIIRMKDVPYVVEIKGYGEKTFLDCTSRDDPMKNAEFRKAATQANLYMYLTNIHQAIILWENKNNQEYRIWLRDFDETLVAPYVLRLQRLKKLMELYRSSQVLPKRRCTAITDPLAKECPLRNACFAGKKERERYRK